MWLINSSKIIAKKNQLITIFLIIFIFFPLYFAIAQENTTKESDNTYLYSIRIDNETAKKGYTVSSFDNYIRLGIRDGILNDTSWVELKRNPQFEYKGIPTDTERISDIFEFDIKNKDAFDNTRPMFLEVKFSKPTKNLKSLYYYDRNKMSWQKLPSRSDNKKQIVRSFIQLPFARLAIFASNTVLEEGKASWYTYKGCECAASPDFIVGTKLRVTNLENNKSIIVTVNDYGPDRKQHPERVIDLDKTAFIKLSPLHKGIINVKIEPLKGISHFAVQVSDPDNKDIDQFSQKLKAKAAIVIDVKTDKILFSKNIDEKLPIASLTKLMTAQILLDQKIPWNRVVTYNSTLDNEIGAKLYVYDGEAMNFRDVFMSSLLSSTNNAINTARRATGLSEQEFVNLMNQKAKDWGLTNTSFVEPTGLDENNISTAREIAKISKEVLKNFSILEATTMKEYSFRTINTNNLHRLENTNKLIHSDLYITGGKTGYTEEAGYCLMTKAKNSNGDEVIAVVLGENDSESRFAETEALLRWALSL